MSEPAQSSSWRTSDDDGNRLPESCDGIACRNDTIKLQDERIDRLHQRVKELEHDISRAMANHVADINGAAVKPKPAHLREPPHCSTCECGMERPTQPPELEDIERLIVEYGNATFACGEFDLENDHADELAYQGLVQAANEAKARAMGAIRAQLGKSAAPSNEEMK